MKRLIFFVILALFYCGCTKIIRETSYVHTTQTVHCRHDLALKSVEENRQNVVFVYGRELDGKLIGFGSGAVIGKDGLILTAYHVVQNKKIASKFVRFDENGKTVIKEVLFEIISAKNDLAILQISHHFKSVIKIAKNAQKSGEPVFIIGRTLLNDFVKIFDKDGIMDYSDKISFGHILIQTRFYLASDDLDTIMIGSDMHTLSGMSGAPVFNYNGEAVGILSRNGALQTNRSAFSWHIDIKHLKKLLEKKEKLMRELSPKK